MQQRAPRLTEPPPQVLLAGPGVLLEEFGVRLEQFVQNSFIHSVGVVGPVQNVQEGR